MDKKERKLRKEIIATCRKMNDIGINQGTSGNVSVKWKKGFLITPSGIPYDDLTPEDMVYMKMDGSHDGHRTPSTEWRFHKDIHANRDEVKAIVHTHSTYATSLAIKGMEIPSVHYMVAVSGGNNIRCAPYATYGTQELSDNALKALEGRTCCLLANHGVIATGPGLAKALWLAKEVETIAQQYVITLQIGGPNLLSKKELEHVVEKFKSYGIQPKAAAA